MDDFSLQVINSLQHGFPLVSRPWACLAGRLGIGETQLIEVVEQGRRDGRVSRVGPVFAPGRIGASVLAALSLPDEQLDAVAEKVSAFPQVNHNYRREHAWNLWFVAAAPSAAELAETLAAIEAAAGTRVLRLPLERQYHIDLGFDLAPGDNCRPRRETREGAPMELDACGRRLVAALQDGLPLVPRPWAAVAEASGLSEHDVRKRVAIWMAQGVVRRLGVVVNHQALGYRANAMVVHDVPDGQADRLGERLAAEPAVTLCYRRSRALPDWRYNLYCMIHGRSRPEVEALIEDLRGRCGLAAHPHAVLFSTRRYKQGGARYA